MKTIAIEEHFKIPAIIEANSGGPQEKAFKLFGSTGIYSTGEDGEVPAGSLDIGLKRLAAMDAGGIDVQVLSLNQPATENLEPELAVKLAAMANDKIAAAVTTHPTRFGGFATLPMPNPKASAAELERMVTNHGFLGALIHGHIRGRYLDDQFFWPVFEMAEKLGVPIYLHPKRPPQAVEDACYGGFETMVSEILATTGWGWHVDTGLHVLRLVLGGVFDRFPKLQIIIGHMGEALPSMIWRANSELGPAAKYLKRRVIDYFQQNIHVTTSGYYAAPDGSIDYAAFIGLLHAIGIDRILFSVDYPYSDNRACKRFLENLPISPDDKEKVAHLNAERLLKFKPWPRYGTLSGRGLNRARAQRSASR